MTQTPIILVKQRHEADRAGLHYDWRVVIGDKAYSWATKKDIDKTNGKLILWEQPVHDREYALSEKVVIPKGQYGAGTTYLDYAQKGTAKFEHGNYYELNLNNGDRYYIKHMPSYGDKAWLLVNLKNKNMEKKADTDKPKKESSWRVGEAVAGGIVGGLTGGKLATTLHSHLIKKLKESDAAGTKDVSLKQVSSYIRENKLHRDATFSPHKYAKSVPPKFYQTHGTTQQEFTRDIKKAMKEREGSSYLSGRSTGANKGLIHVKKTPTITTRIPGSQVYVTTQGKTDYVGALHELGHAKFNRNKLLASVSSRSRAHGTKASLGIGLALASNEKTKKYAVPAAIAAHLPNLMEETYASASPIKHLWKSKNYKGAGNMSKKMTRALGTYFAHAAVPVAVVAGAAHLFNKSKPMQEKKANIYLEKLASVSSYARTLTGAQGRLYDKAQDVFKYRASMSKIPADKARLLNWSERAGIKKSLADKATTHARRMLPESFVEGAAKAAPGAAIAAVTGYLIGRKKEKDVEKARQLTGNVK